MYILEDSSYKSIFHLKKAFIKLRRFEMLMYGATLGSTLIFRLAFLHKSDTWLLKVSL